MEQKRVTHCTEKCRFMDKRVREILRFFVAPPRVFPLSVFACLRTILSTNTFSSVQWKWILKCALERSLFWWVLLPSSSPSLPSFPPSFPDWMTVNRPLQWAIQIGMLSLSISCNDLCDQLQRIGQHSRCLPRCANEVDNLGKVSSPEWQYKLLPYFC